MSERERIRYYTLSEEDIQIIRQQRGATNQLGFAVQFAYLRFPGRPFASGEKKTDFLVSLLAKRLGIVPAAIHHYAKKIILPAMYAIEHLVWAVCERAERRTFKGLTKATFTIRPAINKVCRQTYYEFILVTKTTWNGFT